MRVSNRIVRDHGKLRNAPQFVPGAPILDNADFNLMIEHIVRGILRVATCIHQYLV